MGVAGPFLTGTSLVRPIDGWQPGDADVPWFSWLRWFQYAFIVFTLLAVAGALTANDLSRNQMIAGATIGIALTAWLWWRGRWERLQSNRDALIYFGVLLLLLTAALRAYDGFGLAVFGAYWHGFAYLRIKPAMVYAFILTLLTQIGFSDVGPGSLNEIDIGLPQMLGGIIGLLVAGMMAAYIESLGREAERRRHLLNELRATQAALAAREREAGVAAERQRLAGEIHDTVAQHFTSILTNLEAAESRAAANPEAARDHIRAARDAARHGIADARAMVEALQPKVLDGRSVSDALRHIAADTDPHLDISVRFREVGTPVPLDRVLETILVRALQESLQNVRKHARARLVEVSLSWLDDEVILDISDDGVGFDPGLVPSSGDGRRMGLRTMRQRVESAGGTWTIESSAGDGTSLAISFPLEREKEAPPHA